MTLPLPTLLLGLALAILIGLSLGLMGGGGSILTVPILVYALGLETHAAIATSLLVVGATSAAALIPHARARQVRWRTGLLFGAASMIGAFAAGRVAHHIPGVILLLAFGAMMVVTAVAMMRKKKKAEAAATEGERSYLKILVDGLLVGAVTGLVGAGGGFLVVPALVLFGGVPMRAAVGTSLLVIALKSAAAFVGHASTVEIDYALAAMVTGAAIVGSIIGAAAAGKVPQDVLRRGFAWFVLVMAVFLLAQELPRAFGVDVELAADWPWIVGLLALPLIGGGVDLTLMSIRERELSAPKA